ncbi:MAG: hypothetical protein F6J87_22875 [Spirulina sp. SIO3F2]|nr:hypothetical protein [Spirulina sp. SIO3F2]
MNELFLATANLMPSELLAQTVSDPNVLGQIQAAFQNFIASGQVWAMAIGVVLGYAIRSLTA